MSKRRRRLLAAITLTLVVTAFVVVSASSSNALRVRAATLKLGMTQAEVTAIVGTPDATWRAWPFGRVAAFGKATQLRDSFSNLWLDVTGRAQRHPSLADWPVQVTFDEHDRVVGIERDGETVGQTLRRKTLQFEMTSRSALN